jgi:hypothetical protein
MLFNEAVNQKCSVLEVKEWGWVVQFKTRLQGVMRAQWYDLASKLNRFPWHEEKDVAFWKWSASKKFTVKSVYNHLTKTDDGPNFKRVWSAKVPEKIKTFMWLVEQNAILTKDTMLRKNWQGDPSCYFCDIPKTIDHLFFECPIAKVIWGVIAVCFHQRCRPLSYAQYWAWIPSALPGGERIFMVGLAAVCWAI